MQALVLILFKFSEHLVLSRETIRTNIFQSQCIDISQTKLLTYRTSISQPVCPRTFTKDVHAKANELKSILQNNKQSQRCSTSLTRKPQEKSLSTPCNDINNMTGEELKARNDLQLAGISQGIICVKQQGACDIPGSIDANTNTINMCRTCKFLVYLPSE